jgi:hypothetical protein
VTIAQTIKKPRIASMLEPGPEDQQTAVITAVYRARELLSSAFRRIERGDGEYAAFTDAQAALPLLEGVPPLLRALVTDSRVGEKPHDLVERAIRATRAAIELGGIYQSYTARPHSDWDRRHAPRARQIWMRSTESASQETHRALAELAELLPDGYETEEP